MKVKNVTAQQRKLQALESKGITQLKGIYSRLSIVPCTEVSFIQIEMIFFDTLYFLRSQPGDEELRAFLLQLRQLQEEEYKDAQNKDQTFKNRIKAIMRFKNKLKQLLFLAIN